MAVCKSRKTDSLLQSNEKRIFDLFTQIWACILGKVNVRILYMRPLRYYDLLVFNPCRSYCFLIWILEQHVDALRLSKLNWLFRRYVFWCQEKWGHQIIRPLAWLNTAFIQLSLTLFLPIPNSNKTSKGHLSREGYPKCHILLYRQACNRKFFRAGEVS